MKKVLVFVIVLLGAFSVYWFVLRSKKSVVKEEKQAPITLKKHTEQFNNSVDRAMSAYHEIKTAFVDADTSLVKKHTAIFINRLDSIPLNELEKENPDIYQSANATVADVKSNAQSLLQQ